MQHPVRSPRRTSSLADRHPHINGHRTPTHRLKPREPNLLRGLKEGGHHVTWPGMRGDTLAPDTTEPSVDEYGFGVSPAIRERLGIKDTAAEMWRGSARGAARRRDGRAHRRTAHGPGTGSRRGPGHTGPDGEVGTASRQLARAFVRGQESRRCPA
ncbi:hypothetical protein, partial [Streptomyces sp. NPDC056689]|uniref:hypothetical protein n=1 Tax=Streptomyces sp. NPDC056689 TaxID=3345911 RepID=UPI00368428AB